MTSQERPDHDWTFVPLVVGLTSAFLASVPGAGPRTAWAAPTAPRFGSVAGDEWTRIPPPRPRWGHAAVYDAPRNRMVVFGGWGARDDLWELPLGGAPEWNAISISGGPDPARFGHAFIYDPVRERMVVFGGVSRGVAYNDVWELSLSGTPGWNRISPAGTPPSALWGATAIYDPVRYRMILYSGYDGAVSELTLGTSPTWSMISAAGAPPSARSDHAAVYDPVRNRMLVFGGKDAGYSSVNDLWELTLGTEPEWKTVTPSGTLPEPRYGHAMIYDPMGDCLVIVGGVTAPLVYPMDAWRLTLTPTPTWTMLDPPGTRPPFRRNHTAIYDPVGGQIVVYGGTVSNFDYGDVWGLPLADGSPWAQLVPGDGFEGRSEHSAVVDPVRDRMVVLGGYPSDLAALPLSGTSGWIRLSPPTPLPAPRNRHTAVYDPARNHILVYGGAELHRLPEEYCGYSDWWELSLGESLGWRVLYPGGGGQHDHTTILDPIRDRLVVFGGVLITECGVRNEFSNGVSVVALESYAWTALPLSGNHPSPRASHTAIYDPLRDRMIVFGGYGTSGHMNDVWTLSLGDTPSWSAIAAVGWPPSPRRDHSAIYDPLNDRMLVYGGRDDISESDELWSLSLSGTPAWTLLTLTGPHPGALSGHAAVYDSQRRRMIVAGVPLYDFPADAAWAFQLDAPVPTLVSLVSAEPHDDRVLLTWHGAEAAGFSGSVERRTATADWEGLGTIAADGAGLFRFEDRAVTPGTRYGYRLVYLSDGEKRTTPEAWVEVPAARFAFHAVAPNPATRGFAASFSLPTAAPCLLEGFDLAGRRVFARDLRGLGPGSHRVTIPESLGLQAGVFTLRLTQAGRVAAARGVVLR